MKKNIFAAFFLLAFSFVSLQDAVAQGGKGSLETRVEMTTTEGKMVFLLYNDTPLHRDNFLKLVKQHTYDSLLFHRVIKNFMIQAGDPNSRNAKPGQMLGDGTLGYTVPAEFRPNHIHVKGALCAARQGDNINPRKESSASQFYIVQGQVWSEQQLGMMEQRFGKKYTEEQRKAYTTVGGTPHLDGDYTVFGQLIEGMDVLERIAATPTGAADRPKTDVRILSVRVVN